MFDVNKLAQIQICDLKPYQSGMPIEALTRKYGLDPENIIKLASNENPDGMGARAAKAAQQALADAFRYPDGYPLRQALATHYDLPGSQITLGNGSNDVLDLVARVFLSAGTNAVSSQYGFAVYYLVTKIAGAESRIVAAKEFGHDLQAMRAAIDDNTRVVWIANPNNPTGTFVSYDQVEAFIASLPDHVVVVLDEAYYEYLPSADRANTTSWLQKYPQLILVRTFSKVYGLAGFRVGYALASPEIADLLNRVRQPFNVNHAGIMAATAALGDEEFVASSIERNRAGLLQLKKGFDELNLTYMPAFGNFITVQFADAAGVNEQLLKSGIIVRPLAEYGLPEHLRITVGKPEENERLLAALSIILDDK